MKISDLLSIDLGESISIANEPFTKIGQAEILLEDSTNMFWLYDDDDHMLSVAPKEDELVLFQYVSEEIEPSSDMILFQNKEYEYSYEDSGKVKQVEGDPSIDVEDHVLFSDYESKDGEILRIITNENSGEVTAYVGRTVSEEDVLEI